MNARDLVESVVEGKSVGDVLDEYDIANKVAGGIYLARRSPLARMVAVGLAHRALRYGIRKAVSKLHGGTHPSNPVHTQHHIKRLPRKYLVKRHMRMLPKKHRPLTAKQKAASIHNLRVAQQRRHMHAVKR